LPQWHLKSQSEFIASLSQAEIERKGGLAKLEKQPGNRYFKRRRLADIIFLRGQSMSSSDKELVPAFVHFLYGLLDPDPWKRWTAFQAMQHPFLTGDLEKLRPKRPEVELNLKEENHANIVLDFSWEAPWDAAICRRQLLNVQKMREAQGGSQISLSRRLAAQGLESPVERPPSHRVAPSSRSTAERETARPLARDSARRHDGNRSPPNKIGVSGSFRTVPSGRSIEGSHFSGSIDYRHVASLARPPPTENGGEETSDAFVKRGIFAAPQSFSGIDRTTSRIQRGGDFALALQRPGVVPGTGYDTLSHSQGTLGSVQQENFATQATATITQLPVDGFVQPTLPNHVNHFQQAMPTYPFSQLCFVPPPNLNAVSWSSSSTHYSEQYNATHMLSTTNSSVTVVMPQEHEIRLHEQQAVLQHEQYAISQQYVTPFLGPHFGSQQQAAQQFGVSPGYTMPQQPHPIYIATAPDGVQYYATTSATGQLIVLQPVFSVNPHQSAHRGYIHPQGVSNSMPGIPQPNYQQFQHYQMNVPSQSGSSHQQGWSQSRRRPYEGRPSHKPSSGRGGGSM
jgi:hypothetical protein